MAKIGMEVLGVNTVKPLPACGHDSMFIISCIGDLVTSLHTQISEIFQDSINIFRLRKILHLLPSILSPKRRIWWSKIKIGKRRMWPDESPRQTAKKGSRRSEVWKGGDHGGQGVKTEEDRRVVCLE